MAVGGDRHYAAFRRARVQYRMKMPPPASQASALKKPHCSSSEQYVQRIGVVVVAVDVDVVVMMGAKCENYAANWGGVGGRRVATICLSRGPPCYES